jgi:hypothetical protein
MLPRPFVISSRCGTFPESAAAAQGAIPFGHMHTARLVPQGLLNKDPKKRLDWPDLLEHPFVKESSAERLARQQQLNSAAARAEASRAWKGEGGAIAGAAVYAGAL